jgi:4-hydroxy-tetrahydrodipicolinate reductase
MGHEIMRAMSARAEYALAGVWVRPTSELLGTDFVAVAGPAAAGIRADSDLAAVLDNADVAIDFSLPAASRAVVDAALAARMPLVGGVSGLGDDDLQAFREASRSIPVFYDRNMSIGIAVMRRLVRQAGALLGSEFPAEIHDRHHAKKRDAPSGTALLLGEALANSRGQNLQDVMRYDPAGRSSARDAGDIVFQVTREGECPGRHDVYFTGAAERLSIGHEVSDRAVFALGALRAARWLAGQRAGLYGMDDLLADLTGNA